MAKMMIRPNHTALDDYYKRLKEAQRFADTTHEGNVRRAFGNLLEATARVKDWRLVTEPYSRAKGRAIFVDGVLRDKFNLPHGHWEAKDSADDLDTEIRLKRDKGYPFKNIIFENTQEAVLFQDGYEVVRVEVMDREQLADLLTRFYSYRMEPFEDFNEAVQHFQTEIPHIAGDLNQKIKAAHKENQRFQTAYAAFMELCRTSLNPNISPDAVDEMLIQHMLTERLMRTVFDLETFTRRNVIAAEIEKVIDALAHGYFNRSEFLGALDRFYQAIERAADELTDFSEKQGFINTVYERFFQGYSVKVADTHGIVYTPQEIVDFMVASVAEVLQTEFGQTLGSPGVSVLDPCTGTGNFMVNILRYIAQHHRRDLEAAYRERLFANEVMLLPYYVAALNVEHEFYDLTGKYEPFEGLCFVDTLDLAEGRQMGFSFMSEANAERVERQKQAPITVIIGNPPYNVGQLNENDNNKNRKYAVVDGRVRDTYATDSNATNKNMLYDPYVKFFRWATDRLGDRDGVVCYVSNNSFVDQIAFDGMRQHLMQDFTRIYHIDMHGNVRQNPKISGTTHNVFGIQVGVGITIAVRSQAHDEPELYYHRMPEFWRREEKLAWLVEQLEKPHTPEIVGGPASKPHPQPLPIHREGSAPSGKDSGFEIESRTKSEDLSQTWPGLQPKPKLWEMLKPLGRQMRKEPTPAEKKLWERVRKKRILGHKFRRQHAIDRFIVDFCCADARLIVEVDGPIHDYTQEEDAIRQEFLESLGFQVVRFTNDEVLNEIDRVVEAIETAVQNPPPAIDKWDGTLLNPVSQTQDTAPPHTPLPMHGEGPGVGFIIATTDSSATIDTMHHIPWQPLTPNKRHTWLVPEHADEFADLIPIGSKAAKSSRSQPQTIFATFSGGIKSNRDLYVYDFDSRKLTERMERFVEDYNSEVDRFGRSISPGRVDDFVSYERIKWDSTLKRHLASHRYGDFDSNCLRISSYRPFVKKTLYFDRLFINSIHRMAYFFPSDASENENRVIAVGGYGRKEFAVMISKNIPDLNFYADPAQCFPFYTYDEDGSNRRENITDWALDQFRQHYGDATIDKWAIFYYVYGLLHHPDYRARYADSLKRELPRIPFAPDFWVFSKAGRKLADLHLTYEEAEPYRLKWEQTSAGPMSFRVEKMRLKGKQTPPPTPPHARGVEVESASSKGFGERRGGYSTYTHLVVNETLTLHHIPPQAFAYRLGNRSALEWVVDQYRIKTDKRSGITHDPNTYGDERYIVDLVEKVVRVSVDTVGIVDDLAQQSFS